MSLVARILFGTVTFFNDPALEAQIESGRTSLPLTSLGGVSDVISTGILIPFLKLFVTPNFTPPDWWPVLPISIENTLIEDPTAWVGQEGTDPIDPRNDPFYHPDISTYQNAALGTVLNVREVGLSVIWASVSKAYQLSYRTQNTFGDAAADVSTVIIPTNPNGKVISYQMWEDSASLQCSPSYSIVTGVSDPTLELLILLGYVVNWPDHEGVKSSFGCGKRAGYSTLDSMKAYLSYKSNWGLKNGTYDKIVMWGYSGGSMPTGHAAELQPTYAPELTNKLIGAVAGGFCANLTSLVDTMNGGLFSGLSVGGLYGLTTDYPAINSIVQSKLKPGKKWRFNYAGKTCLATNVLNNILINAWAYTSDSTGKSLLGDSGVQSSLQNELMGYHAAPQIPMIIYQGVQDEVADVVEVDRSVNYYCSQGTKVDYYRLGALGHVGTEILSIIDGLRWIADLHNGYVPGSCTGVSDATKATVLEHQSDANAQWDNIVRGKWEASGILNYSGIKPN